jgi:hypothetical protein
LPVFCQVPEFQIKRVLRYVSNALVISQKSLEYLGVSKDRFNLIDLVVDPGTATEQNGLHQFREGDYGFHQEAFINLCRKPGCMDDNGRESPERGREREVH